MKIALVEMDTHAEIVEQFLRIAPAIPNLALTCWVSPKIQKRLPLQFQAHTKVCTPDALVEKLKDQHFDLVLIGTLHRHFDVFHQLVQQQNCAVVVHNRCFHEMSFWRLLPKLWRKDCLYHLKLCWKEKLYLKNKIRQHIKHSFVLDEALTVGNYQTLPLFFTRFLPKASPEKCLVVVPGTVAQSRRDYEHIIAQLQAYNGQKSFEICFLGQASPAWVARFEALKLEISPKISLTYFDQKVSPEDFAQYMQSAHVLWCPIQNRTHFMGVAERYGHSKYSGNIGDAITYGQWAVFPSGFEGDYPFVIKTDDLLEILALAEVKNGHPQPYSLQTVAEKLAKTLADYLMVLKHI